MKSKAILIFFTAAILMPSICSADGKFYARRGSFLELPHQRAILIFNGNEEILLLQSKFNGSAKDFGWVLPFPQITELASMKSEESDKLFHDLVMSTQPETSSLPYGTVSLIIVIAISLWIGAKGKGWAPGCFSLMVVVMMAIAIPQFGGRPRHVEVIREEKVGIYDVKVIKGKDPKAIISWLRAHNYDFDEKDHDAFQQYVEKDWCFLTARIDQEKINESSILSQGMVNPILVRFTYQKPVYPLILTGTAGRPTDLVLYAFAKTKVSTNSSLQLKYAGTDNMFVDNITDLVDLTYKPESEIPKVWQNCTYLTKFSGDLSPENMNEDLILNLAPKYKKPFRETEANIGEAFLFMSAIFLLLLLLIHLFQVSYRDRKKKESPH